MAVSDADLRHFRITGPTVVCNSGGKTSGYNLWLHLKANGGTLTENGRCVFTNTGWEHPLTLDFLAEQERRWGVGIVWLEFEWRQASAAELEAAESKWQKAQDRVARFRSLTEASFTKRLRAGHFLCPRPEEERAAAVARAGVYARRCFESWRKAQLIGLPSYRVVTRATASTDGRPFTDLLEGLLRFRSVVKGEAGILPTGADRICTGHLKMRVSAGYARDTWGVGPSGYEARLGLRADEVERVASAYKAKNKEAGRPILPLDDAGIDKEDVAAFWAAQPFGMSLKGHQGNCGGCHQKRREALVDLIRRKFFDVAWWQAWEQRTGMRFRQERTYRGLEIAARTEHWLIPPDDDFDSGITCEEGYCTN